MKRFDKFGSPLLGKPGLASCAGGRVTWWVQWSFGKESTEMVGGFYTEDGPHWGLQFHGFLMGGASHKYAVRWPTSYKILAVSVQTRVELSCFIVHLEFFSHRQGSLQEIRLSWMRSGHQSESFNQRSRFPKDHSRSRGPILFCKVGSWLLSPHLQPYDMAFLCLDFCFNGDFYEFRNKFQFSFKLSWNWDFSHLRVENTSIFLCTVRGLKSVLTLAAEVQGVLLKGAQIADCWVVLCIGLH